MVFFETVDCRASVDVFCSVLTPRIVPHNSKIAKILVHEGMTWRDIVIEYGIPSHSIMFLVSYYTFPISQSRVLFICELSIRQCRQEYHCNSCITDFSISKESSTTTMNVCKFPVEISIYHCCFCITGAWLIFNARPSGNGKIFLFHCEQLAFVE